VEVVLANLSGDGEWNVDEVQVAPVIAGFVLADFEGEQSVDVDLGATSQFQVKFEVARG